MRPFGAGFAVWEGACVGEGALVLTFLLLAASNGLAQHYQRTDLTTDNATVSPTAPNVDPNLVNPWGMARSSGSPWWISDNGPGLSTLYDSTGLPKPLVVTIPAPNGQPGGTPTGTVFNYTGAFDVGPGQSAFFLFATEDGTISGWNPGANPTAAIIKVNRAGSAIYKGLALATQPSGRHVFTRPTFRAVKSKYSTGNFTGLAYPVFSSMRIFRPITLRSAFRTWAATSWSHSRIGNRAPTMRTTAQDVATLTCSTFSETSCCDCRIVSSTRPGALLWRQGISVPSATGC